LAVQLAHDEHEALECAFDPGERDAVGHIEMQRLPASF
jgi:hypothetical protein